VLDVESGEVEKLETTVVTDARARLLRAAVGFALVAPTPAAANDGCGLTSRKAVAQPGLSGQFVVIPVREVMCSTPIAIRNSFNAEVTMHSIRRPVTVAAVAILSTMLITDVATLSAQAKDPRVGTWMLNLAKSKYSPGPAPQSQTLTVEAVGNGEKVTSEVVAADGKRTTTTYTANFDGKDYPLTGSALGADKVSLKRINARTTERTDKKDGKVMVHITRVVSPDGKMMTATVKGTNAEGQAVNNVVVFEKQ
jgi:hypothetical protein